MATLNDSRRLTGPNLLSDEPGAVLDVTLEPGREAEAVERWRRTARAMLDEVGWSGERLYHRTFPGGASLMLSAPIDALYAATEVNEWAWESAMADLEGKGTGAPSPAEVAARLRGRIAEEQNPALIALATAAHEHDVAFLSDSELASVGLGRGVRVWPVGELPSPGDVPWKDVHDIPVALVTGCNGKTTTVRLIAAIIRAAGRVPGFTSTDVIRVGDDDLDRGDWAGPSGARMLLRDTRVEIAVLEAARGGILRRGLGVRRAQVSVITNVAEDHLGEFGIHDLRSLTETKMVVARVVGPEGHVVLNADDPGLRAVADRVLAPITWFTLEPHNTTCAGHRRGGGTVVTVVNGEVILDEDGERRPIIRVDEIPIALDGLARHNVANVLAAVGAAAALGMPLAAMRLALQAFSPTSEDSPGRLNLFDLGGVKVILDFAHNPHGVSAVVEMAAAMPATRRLVLLGQAGDRDDESLRALARAAWSAHPDRIVIKELPQHLRGRETGEVPAVLEDEFRRLGAPPERVVRTESEMAGVRHALGWARVGDLLLLPVQGEREATLQLLRKMEASHWQAGDALPD